MEVEELIFDAIEDALTAGACWHAAKIDERHAATWESIARDYSKRAATHLADMVERSGV